MLAAAVQAPAEPALSDEQLMLAAGRGDRGAFAAIVDRHHRRVLNLLLFLCGDREMAQDLTQDCFLRLLRAAPRYEPRAKLTTFLTTIARRLAFDARAKVWERREPLKKFEPASPNPGPDAQLERRERAERLAAVLAEIAEEDREVLVLSEVGGLKYREIAELLSVPEGTVASRKNRAIRRARELWNAREKEGDGMNRDEDVQKLFESAGVEPTVAERAAILTAAEPILAEHAAAAGTSAGAAGRVRRSGAPSLPERLRALFAPRRLAFAAGLALVVAVVLIGRGTPPTRETRSAPLQSWAEHLQADPGGPFPLVSESYGRLY